VRYEFERMVCIVTCRGGHIDLTYTGSIIGGLLKKKKQLNLPADTQAHHDGRQASEHLKQKIEPNLACWSYRGLEILV